MSQAKTPNKTVWFVTGSQALYGPETLEQVAEQSRQVVRQLADGLQAPVELVWKPVVLTADQIRRTLLDATSDDDCVGVVVWMHTFSPAKMWIAGFEVLHKPLLHLHTQANQSLPWSTIDMDFMNLNQAAHGDRELAHLAARANVARTIVVGHPTSPAVAAKVTDWARAALGWHTMRTLRLARFGDNMRFVAVTDGDKTGAQLALGMSVEQYGVNSLVDAVAEVADADAEALTAEYEELYDVAPELRRGGDRHESLVYGAKIEIALRHLLTAGGFGAFTSNFEDLGGLRQLPGLAVQRLMADGYGFGGEGDWKTSALLATMKAMTTPGGGTSFMEDYTYHFGPGPERVLGAHMLEVCPSIADGTPRIEIHPLGIGGREDPVRMVFTGRPGPGRVVCLVDLGDRFRFVANEITVVAPDESLPNLPVARAVWEPAPDLATSAEAWMLAAGSHHTVLTTDVPLAAVEHLARMAASELVVIDGGTTIRRHRADLEAGAAYHRLAAGLTGGR
ncbi:L-arabinose isomerase [Kineosporia sp. A_224]|uniref:L-arabinose isomerase n=1 Tax=Kineosporia sp. A_224 TaxID=1962180 RepID=UPI000B4B531D|nr:L-arabinose isomerase [Kineosporia sp. A_224]